VLQGSRGVQTTETAAKDDDSRLHHTIRGFGFAT
jgi:hypothetical protein